MGRIWSVDAWLRARKAAEPLLTGTGKHVSVATAALIVQLVLMYFFSGVAKWNDDWWGGDAMYYVLHLDIFVNDFGKQMLEYPLLLKLVTFGTLLAEVFLVWTLFRRSITAAPDAESARFLGFHIGIGLTMSIGLFSDHLYGMLAPTAAVRRLGLLPEKGGIRCGRNNRSTRLSRCQTVPWSACYCRAGLLRDRTCVCDPLEFHQR